MSKTQHLSTHLQNRHSLINKKEKWVKERTSIISLFLFIFLDTLLHLEDEKNLAMGFLLQADSSISIPSQSLSVLNHNLPLPMILLREKVNTRYQFFLTKASTLSLLCFAHLMGKQECNTAIIFLLFSDSNQTRSLKEKQQHRRDMCFHSKAEHNIETTDIKPYMRNQFFLLQFRILEMVFPNYVSITLANLFNILINLPNQCRYQY